MTADFAAAACRAPDVDPALFFVFTTTGEPHSDPAARGSIATQRRKAAPALAVCARCPVRDACLAAFISDRWCVVGGTVPLERKMMLRQARAA